MTDYPDRFLGTDDKLKIVTFVPVNSKNKLVFNQLGKLGLKGLAVKMGQELEKMYEQKKQELEGDSASALQRKATVIEAQIEEERAQREKDALSVTKLEAEAQLQDIFIASLRKKAPA